MLALASMFLFGYNPLNANATIEGVSGNMIVLTGLTGSSPKHFFYDENGQSTFINAEVKNNKGKYYDIVSKGKGLSSGWSDFKPTTDMIPFIENGILYATASAEIVSQNSTIKLTISNGSKKQEVKILNGKGETPLLKIETLENIKFSFSSLSEKNDYVIKTPTIHLYTQIDEVVLNCEDQAVSAGELVKVDAYNKVTQISGSAGNFMSLSKVNHAIEFEITKGGNYAKFVGKSLVVSDNAPSGTTIIFRAYSKKNSYSNEKIYSKEVTFIVDNEKINLKIKTDFNSPADFSGEGIYNVVGKKITLQVRPHKDFEFLGWYVNGEFKSKNSIYFIYTEYGQEIYAKFRKAISVSKIEVPAREYDGTKNITEEMRAKAVVTFDGLENNHEVKLDGVNYQEFFSASVGKNKEVSVNYDEIKLIGADSDKYKLKSTILPKVYGEITKRNVVITPKNATKEYGDSDPIIEFTSNNLANGETISGSLSREAGEKIGAYKILSGNLAQRNLNYNIILEDSNFEITKRTLRLQNLVVEDKIYNRDTLAQLKFDVANIYNSEDVKVNLISNFKTSNVGNNIEVKINAVELTGTSKNNYRLEEYSQKIYGNILPKEIEVKAQDCTIVYGDEIKLDYVAKGLILGDKLNGSLSIDGREVGEYDILLGTLNNSNYKITKFESGTCKIEKRQILVKADALRKTYGDDDPILTYQTENLVNDDFLYGELARENGEDVGKYQINLGTLNNSNYEINFEENFLEISEREIFVSIEFFDKEYDGTSKLKWEVNFLNNKKNDNFELEMNAEISNKDCGINTINVLSKTVVGENIKNYYFTYKFLNSQIEIVPRNAYVLVDEATKIFGDSDPSFNYDVKNVIDGDVLTLDITRQSGEDVGTYRYEAESQIIGNYQISLFEAYFEILPKQVEISVENQYKNFGDEEPEILFEVLGKFCFDDTAQSVIDGHISREEGEKVGVYSYDTTSLSSNKNYSFSILQDSSFIILKRKVTVISKNATKVYGQEDPKFEYSVLDEVEGEKLIVDITRQYGENVGQYQLICATTNDSRYSIDFKSAFLTITPSEISIKAEDKLKIYGENDPIFSVVITSGFLKNNDRLENISSGALSRNSGEQVGDYQINLGTFSLGENYKISFEAGNLKIITRNITISAQACEKIYGDKDESLTFLVSGEGLAFDDKIEGELIRAAGEDVGSYQILLGTLAINDNYKITFKDNIFKIIPRQIEIVPTNTSKEYGDDDAPLEYQIKGEMIGQDVLNGKLFYESKDQTVGMYPIISTLENSNYEIVFKDYYFSILPRKIVVQAESFVINYGDDEPNLSYQIISGTILNGDEIQGIIFRQKGDSAGTYDIISKLSLGRNYQIEFIKGTVTILPLKIKIRSENYQKIYGQQDPSFGYEIVEGKLINGDVLYGALTRELGEDVGSYSLVNGVYNANYDISLEANYQLTIFKKEVYLMSGVYSKVYDGTTNARIKNPYISGAIDKEVYLSYDQDNCAEFESAEIGENIEVHLHDITLTGEKAPNYQLILPSELYANITLGQVVKGDVSLSTNSPVILKDYRLNFDKQDAKFNIKNHQVVAKLDIWFEIESNRVETDGMFRIKILLPNSLKNKNNVYIYQKQGDELKIINAKKDGDVIVLDSTLGEFYIAVEDEQWLDISMYVSIAVIGLLGLLLFVVLKRRKNKIKTSI